MRRDLFLMVVLAAAGAFALDDIPNATHAWGVNDYSQPRPFAVKVAPGAYPSDAIGFTDAAKIPAKVAADAQLHFAVKGEAKLAFFGVNALADVAAKPGEDGWIVYDVVFHRPGEGHPGILTVLVNGLLAKDVAVARADGQTPLALSGRGLFGAWIRSTPAPWANKLAGRYADKAAVRASRAATAARLYDGYLNLTTLPQHGEIVHRCRKIESIIGIYAYCQDEPYATAFREECEKVLQLVNDGKVSSGHMLTIARALFPLQKQNIVPKDFPLVLAMKAKGTKAW